MLSIIFVGSGSKGNATLIKSNGTIILIDDGLPKYRIVDGLKLFNASLDDINAIFITHNHSDHIKGVSLLPKQIPLYASNKTFDASTDYIKLKPYKPLKIGSINIVPISSSHDAPNPLNYIIYDEDESMGYITDTGFLSERNLALLKNKTYYLLESNHDLTMELNSNRPKVLIDRVIGDKGHLSNVASAGYACKIIGDKTKGIYLGHLSKDCNNEEKAISSYKNIFKKKNVDFSKYEILVTKQDSMVLGGSW
ncbi:MAG TPA: MBL fold metallo-hydrolase [Firmicutes bacterium]|nr:MBL fold metallo-hydrolase [Bacillota bacterium]HBM70684.1 MBL fold metallo-hydrolase [Bacillota bacterium]